MQVDERTASGSSAVGGSNYYFCSAGCKKKFEANSSEYVGAPPAANTKRPAVAGAVPPGTVYTCPMHPEIVRVAPGDCPICGMALAPIAGTGAGQRRAA